LLNRHIQNLQASYAPFPSACAALPLVGIPFGFDGDINSGGFASSTNRVYVDAGKFCRIVYTSDKDIHGHT